MQFTSVLGCKNKSYCASFPVSNVNFCSFVEEPGFNGSHELSLNIFSLLLLFKILFLAKRLNIHPSAEATQGLEP